MEFKNNIKKKDMVLRTLLEQAVAYYCWKNRKSWVALIRLDIVMLSSIGKK
jgi:hypothetical protein